MLDCKVQLMLDIIADYCTDHRRPPTLSELCRITGQPPSAICEDYLKVLEDRGYIQIRHRGNIELVRSSSKNLEQPSRILHPF